MEFENIIQNNFLKFSDYNLCFNVILEKYELEHFVLLGNIRSSKFIEVCNAPSRAQYKSVDRKV